MKEEEANPSTKEVLRYREALWEGYKTLQATQGFTMDTILHVFQKIKNTNQTIRPPQSQTVIKRGQSEFRPGEIVYTPPRGEGIIKKNWKTCFNF